MRALFALEFPPVDTLVQWQPLFLEGTPFEINKVVLLMWLAVFIVLGMFIAAGRKSRASLVPAGVTNVVEFGVEFVRKDVVLQTIGPEGLGYTPFLTTVFFFVFILNIFEVIPGIQMPVNARMAIPAFLAIVVWAIFNFVGVKNQGLGGYFKSMLFPPGVPKALLPLVALIELVSTVFVRPFSLAVRLFANMLAGHLLLVSFAVLSQALFEATIVGAVVPFALLVALTGFELLVSGLQAFIFVILTAVYIGGAMHPEQ
ncbi:MAG: F0F1 ATP synthase subunit A [Acidimicrobiales bacterium]